jgi:hypothetical protein
MRKVFRVLPNWVQFVGWVLWLFLISATDKNWFYKIHDVKRLPFLHKHLGLRYVKIWKNEEISSESQ